MGKYINKSKLLGKIGTENYRVSDCPVHLPKENVKFFMAMQDAGNKDPFSSDTWGNQITKDWKKTIHESIMHNVSKELGKTLNESFDFNSNNILNEGVYDITGTVLNNIINIILKSDNQYTFYINKAIEELYANEYTDYTVEIDNLQITIKNDYEFTEVIVIITP